MSGFLDNLARRGAGLSMVSVRPPATLPRGAEAATPQLGAMEVTVEARPEAAVDALRPIPEASHAMLLPATPPELRAEAESHGAVQSSQEAAPPAVVQAVPAAGRIVAPSASESVPAREPAATSMTAVTHPAPPSTLVRPFHPLEGEENSPASEPKALSSPAAPPAVTRSIVLATERPHGPRPVVLPLILRPAAAESHVPLRILPFPAPSPRPLPIHVRIGRVEVRGAPPATPNPAAPAPPPALGFGSYARVRSYRNWPS